MPIHFEFINKSTASVYYALINYDNPFMEGFFYSSNPKNVKLREIQPNEIHRDNDQKGIPLLDLDCPTTLVLANSIYPHYVHIFSFTEGKKILIEYGRCGLDTQPGTAKSMFLLTKTGLLKHNAAWLIPDAIITKYEGPLTEYNWLLESDNLDENLGLVPYNNDQTLELLELCSNSKTTIKMKEKHSPNGALVIYEADMNSNDIKISESAIWWKNVKKWFNKWLL